MSAHRVTEDEHRDSPRGGRDDMLLMVRQRLSQNARVVRLSGRTRRAVGEVEPIVAQPTSPDTRCD